MARLILPYQRVEDLNGHPLPGAKMYFYESETVTPKDTYSDEALSVPNANPVIADSQGQFGDIFLSGAYSCKLDDADDVTQPDYPAEIEAAADTSSTVLLTGDQTIAGEKTFINRTSHKANIPIVEWEENDAPTNNRIYQIMVNGKQFAIRIISDDRISITDFITLDRAANVIDDVTINSGNTLTVTSTNSLNLVTADLQHNGITIGGVGTSGTYTPSLTNVANVATSTVREATYIRMDNIVIVSGKVTFTVTTPGILTQFTLSLPVASTLAATWDLSGSGGSVADVTAVDAVAIEGDTTADEARVISFASGTTGNSMSYTFQYEVL